jgi:long-chain acyl-CoA synthetase
MTDHRTWFASYSPDVPHTLEPYRERSLFSILEESARRFPSRPAAVWFVPGGRTLTYAELLRDIERFSAVLASLGVNKGDRVGLILPNCPQYVIAYYATVRLGGVIVGNNPLYTQRELSYQLGDAGCDVVVVLDRLWPNLKAIEKEVRPRVTIVTGVTDYMKFPINVIAPVKLKREAQQKGHPRPPVPRDAPVKWWKDIMRRAGSIPPVAEVDPVKDPAGFIYTGGTMGLSKGAMLSHHNLVGNCMQGAAWFGDLRDGEDSILCVLPFFHSYGMTVGMNIGIFKAAKLILMPRFELEACLKAITKEKPSLFPGIPRIYIALNEAPQTKDYDLSSVRACLSGAAPLPLAVAEKFESITGGPGGGGLWAHRDLPDHSRQPHHGQAEGRIDWASHPRHRLQANGHRRPHTGCRAGPAGRARHLRPAGDAGVLEPAGRDRRDDPRAERRAVAVHRRHRQRGRGGILPDRRPEEGDGSGFRL